MTKRKREEASPTFEEQKSDKVIEHQGPASAEMDVEPTFKLPSLNLLSPGTFRRIRYLIHDLHTYQKNPSAAKRVEKANFHPFCLGPPYLSNELANSILDAKSGNLTLREYIGGIVEGKRYHVCASHTLAPLFMELFEIEYGFEQGKEFREGFVKFASAANYCGDGVVVPET